MVYLQQDAFDDVDVSAPLARQQETFDLVYKIARTSFEFEDKDSARKFFTEQTSLFKNLNYAADGSQERQQLLKRIETGVHAAPQRLTD
jgi:V/A-type H+-transporting ATPase subunit A